MSQLERLARPFPDRLIHSNPSGGGSYVKHSVVTEKLLAVLGPFSFELVEVIRGHVAGREGNPDAKSARGRSGTPSLDGAVVGVVCRLSVVVDGREVRVEEVGDCEDPHNWPHDGARLKDAMSDSLKRAAMRLGVTLHLWSGPEFSLYDQLRQENAEAVNVERGSSRASKGGADEGASSAASTEPAASASTSPLLGESAGAGVASSSLPAPDAAPASRNQLQRVQAKMKQLLADNVKIADRRTAEGLPSLTKDCTAVELDAWEALLARIESELEAPFAEAKS